MKYEFDDISGCRFKLHVVNEGSPEFWDEIAWRLEYAQRDVAGTQHPASETHSLVWDIEASSPSTRAAPEKVRDAFRSITSSSDVGLLEELADARRSRNEFLQLLVFGVNSDVLTPWHIHSKEAFFSNLMNNVHFYSGSPRSRTRDDVRTYMENKRFALDRLRRGEVSRAQNAMEDMDTLFYVLDRCGWTYRTHSRPQDSEKKRKMSLSPVTGGPMEIDTERVATVLEDQSAYADVEKTSVVVESM